MNRYLVIYITQDGEFQVQPVMAVNITAALHQFQLSFRKPGEEVYSITRAA